MKQHEAVIKVMEECGGYATLGDLNRLVSVVEWKTKTPFASIRRIVQVKDEFFKIRPGLWALTDRKAEILKRFAIEEGAPKKKIEEFNHSYYQGLLVDIGNAKDLQTYVPRQDKNRKFLSKSLGELSTLDRIYDFTYSRIVKRAETIDVTWFNERNYPSHFFEVEHTTDFNNSLLKFAELQDFFVEFRIVAPEVKHRSYQEKISLSGHAAIKDRVQFWNYDRLSQLHAKTIGLRNIEAQLNM